MTRDRSTGYTPFFLVYGAEAIMSSDIVNDSLRFAVFTEINNESAQRYGLDLLEEAQELSLSLTTGQDLRHYHSRE